MRSCDCGDVVGSDDLVGRFGKNEITRRDKTADSATG